LSTTIINNSYKEKAKKTASSQFLQSFTVKPAHGGLPERMSPGKSKNDE